MMDAYTLHLLGMAESERKPGETLTVRGGASRTTVIIDGGEHQRWHKKDGPTLADALALLLADLGVEVPERPAAERVQRVRRGLPADQDKAWTFLRADSRRLAVLALLEAAE